MLKALELVGFKSFADKTRFEFPAGITVVVGPNGSGKSNIVDAIKWVLGEQSVKSLRGKEMTDVIFNGSGSRRAMNSAEITVTFDNSNHLFPVDSPEVHFTRRVFRSGEGEYLINRNPARLRDIRDMLSGTGMGAHAYSVIEQGKVDILLQSSPRDRRLIFEEAAGISRFKAKKIEALRRLERVDQNLLRLSDIVDEVDSRLRSVRMQAGKARRYKEHADRLQELRTQVGLADWRRLSEKLAKFEAELTSLADQRDGAAAEVEAAEAQLLETENGIGDVTEAIRQSESRIAANRERIATHESTIEHERRRSRDLEQEISRQRRQLVAMNSRAGDLRQQLEDTRQAVQEAEEQHRQVGLHLVEGERELTGVMSELDHVRGENEQRRAAYMDQMRAAATLGNESSALQSQVEAASSARQRTEQRLAELEGQIDATTAELDDLRHRLEQLVEQSNRCEEAVAQAKARLTEWQEQFAANRDELVELKRRHTGTAERISVLEELERRQEGLSAGVKQVLAAANEPGEGPYREVRGLVADLLNVSVEIAPLVDVALGPSAQYVVVSPGGSLLDHLKDQSQQLAGRVGFIWLDPSEERPDGELDLEGRPGVLGRADRFVKTDTRYAALAQRLLGHTWIVEKLGHAIELAESVGLGVDFVTLAGELLAADGTLAVGPQHGSVGLISRRSQLRALKEQAVELQEKIDRAEEVTQRLSRQIDEQTQHLEARMAEQRQAADALAEHRFEIITAEQRRGQFDQQRSVLEAELQAAVTQHESGCGKLAEAQAKRKQIDYDLAETETQLAQLDEQLNRLEGQRQVHGRETTQTKVELAKSEERLRNLHARMRQFEEGRQERHRAISDTREQLAQSIQRADQSRRSILHCESEVAQLYLHKERYAGKTVELINRRELLYSQRADLSTGVQKIQSKIHKIEEKIHAGELAASEVRHDRNGLADRLREDYRIELAELEQKPTDEEQHQREEVQQEIDELRQKISNIGHVNLDALEELDELEGRHGNLSSQYSDLTEAKTSLEKIIDRINIDSRRLFSETLETVRGHFQTLFRDLFGGGHADIVLEEDVDILESGIEIVARPPGKEPRSISLLSGGEKTLTCVALLLAIFRSRPSPFCVLDEVDAALDEANIDRFTKVLHDFLAWTQFIIVTHSKKTMTHANSIYGVTMQESGVSKQVSVRFEDVSEDGHISQERLDAEQEPEPEAPEPGVDDDTQAA